MTKAARFLGRDLTEKLLLQNFSRLCSDVSFHVRRVCAANFGEFCAIIGQELSENVLVRLSLFALLLCFCSISNDAWSIILHFFLQLNSLSYSSLNFDICARTASGVFAKHVPMCLFQFLAFAQTMFV